MNEVSIWKSPLRPRLQIICCNAQRALPNTGHRKLQPWMQVWTPPAGIKCQLAWDNTARCLLVKKKDMQSINTYVGHNSEEDEASSNDETGHNNQPRVQLDQHKGTNQGGRVNHVDKGCQDLQDSKSRYTITSSFGCKCFPDHSMQPGKLPCSHEVFWPIGNWLRQGKNRCLYSRMCFELRQLVSCAGSKTAKTPKH